MASLHSWTGRGSECESPDPANTVTDRLNTLLNSSGPSYILKLCPRANYVLQAPLKFGAPYQEISTVGYPVGNDRATLTVMGPVTNGKGHTTAVDGTGPNLDGVKLRYVQIDGTRGTGSPTDGGANIEMGGGNSGQVVEYVKSFDPRSWSCLHISEGPLTTCNGTTVQFNDIGPCGSDKYQQWADGISLSCRNSVVRRNTVNSATDGAITIFNSPGSIIEENTIWIENNTALGGINLVDVGPFSADYTATIVQGNTIVGGNKLARDTSGQNVILKIGIAIGPKVWMGQRYGDTKIFGGTVRNNTLSGAMGYGIAVSGVKNFEVSGNTVNNTATFIGSRGPNCTTDATAPTLKLAFVYDTSTVLSSTLQPDFQSIPTADNLTCDQPPPGSDFGRHWLGSNVSADALAGPSEGPPTSHIVALVLGILGAIIVAGIGAWFIRRWAIRKAAAPEKDRRMSDAYGGYITL